MADQKTIDKVKALLEGYCYGPLREAAEKWLEAADEKYDVKEKAGKAWDKLGDAADAVSDASIKFNEMTESTLKSIAAAKLANAHSFITMLPKGYGKIINTASLITFSGGMYIPAYAAAKGGIGQITKTFCNEWASKGINVNAIAPGYMATDNLKGLDEERMRTIMDRLPVQRLGTPEDMVGPALFLASHASDYIHGTILLVDGGWMAR